jgi:hypothetical protein
MSGFQDINIRPLIEKYTLINFIETGCHTGSGINHAINSGMKNIYSCDIDIKFVKMCQQIFPGAYIVHGHSVNFLKNIVDIIPGNCLIWLDAHFPALTGGVANNEEENFPLFKELEVLSKKDGIEEDVIIVDDIRVIISDDNPIKQDFDDQYKIRGATIKQLTDLFPNHNHEIVNFQEGLLIFTPKS